MNELEDVNIRHIKLVSGEEILALISKVDSRRHLVLVERPLAITSLYMGEKETYHLSDWMPVSTEELTSISATHIVAQAEVSNTAKEAYIRYCVGIDDASRDEDDDAYASIDKSKLH